MKFSMSKFSKDNNYKNKQTFFYKLSSGNLFIILYHLTKFEAPRCNTFGNILITKFQYDPLKRHNSIMG